VEGPRALRREGDGGKTDRDAVWAPKLDDDYNRRSVDAVKSASLGLTVVFSRSHSIALRLSTPARSAVGREAPRRCSAV
jgi:hypothetical protein